MLTKNTVFILGAGASHPYGYPTGWELVAKLRDADTDELSGRLDAPRPEVLRFQQSLKRAAGFSIDEFLRRRPEFLDIGKRAIAREILACESEDWLYKPAPGRRNPPWDDWYPTLLTAIKSDDALKRARLRIITFNYDLSLEMLLFNTLTHAFGRSTGEAAALMVEIPIVHIHGALGRLQWQKDNGLPARDYGESQTIGNVKSIASKLQLISESAAETAVEQATAALSWAERIFILGFGYHDENMQRLQFNDLVVKTCSSHGTCYGMTPAQEKFLTAKWKGLILGSSAHRITEFLRHCPEFVEAL